MMLKVDEIAIELMEEKHIKEISRIEERTFSQPWSENSIRAELDKQGAMTLVASYDGQVVGFINTITVIDEVYINKFAVDEDFRGKGIGGRLLDELEKRILEYAAFLTLEVRHSNKKAQDLYTKFGFQTFGLRKKFYENPVEDALLMTKIYKSPNMNGEI